MSETFDARGRVEDLEMLVAHQAREIEELSAELKKAFDAITLLQRQNRHLTERFQAVEDALPKPEATKPPHY
jgi:SlyX protein